MPNSETQNHFTHSVELWLMNDEYLYDTCLDIARRAHPHTSIGRAATGEQRETYITYHVAEAIEALVDEQLPELDAGIALDLIRGAMAEVDWNDIAASFRQMMRDDNIMPICRECESDDATGPDDLCDDCREILADLDEEPSDNEGEPITS